MCKSVAIKSKISEVRIAKNITQLDLAVELGIDPAQLRRIERIGNSKSTHIGKSVSIGILDKLCFLLDCQPGDLFVYIKDENNVQTV